MSALVEAGVRFDYEHGFKQVQPGATITAGGALLKWYEIAPASAPVPPAICDVARQALEGAMPDALELGGELGFVILHRCGESFYFLLLSTWRNDNELWETVWAKDGNDATTFEPWPIGRGHRPTYCVWELGAVCHEQRAWSRYLRSARDARAKESYLGDSYAGLV